MLIDVFSYSAFCSPRTS